MTQDQPSPDSSTGSPPDSPAIPSSSLFRGLLDSFASPIATGSTFFGEISDEFIDPPTNPLSPNQTSDTMSFTAEQISEIISKLHKPTRVDLSVNPRIGGKTSTGIWTGLGAGGEGLEPFGSNCFRAFATDVIRNHSSMSPIETKCKKGLKDMPEVHFCMPDEPNSGGIVSSLQCFEEHVTSCGMETVFIITKSDGSTLNMLAEPGMTSREIVSEWCKQVLVTGIIPEDSPTPLDKCPYDRTNMLWSGEALLNSCTETLRQDLKLAVAPGDRNGPHLLMELLSKLYRPSSSKIRRLQDSLEALDLRKYPAENVILFVQDATKLVREIRMNFMRPEDMPSLTSYALNGLKHASDDLLRNKVRDARVSCDNNAHGSIFGNDKKDALEALKHIVEYYTVLVDMGDYGPAQAPTKAMTAAIVANEAKLVQDRNAQSSRGGGNNNSGRPQGVCWDCLSPSHFRGDPSCPKKSTTDQANGTGINMKNKHGLDEATTAKVLELAHSKLKTMPPRENIPDDATYDIKLDGKIMAKYCRHCGRFSKGVTAHYTSEHKGTRMNFKYVGPPPATGATPPAPATATAAVARVHFEPPAKSCYASSEKLDLSKVPVVNTSEMLENRYADHDFGTMPVIERLDASLATCLEAGDEEGFLENLVKGYGG